MGLGGNDVLALISLDQSRRRDVKPLPHQYDVHLVGGPVGYGRANTLGVPLLPMAQPPQYDGPGDAWTPEHLLLAAVQGCFLFTLRAVARASKLDFVSLEVETSGTVDRRDGVTRFVEIVLRPTLVVPAGTERDRALRLLEKTEKACLVSSSLSTPVRLEARVTEHEPAPSVLPHGGKAA
jgi:peroxiredoxin-like protein